MKARSAGASDAPLYGWPLDKRRQQSKSKSTCDTIISRVSKHVPAACLVAIPMYSVMFALNAGGTRSVVEENKQARI